MYTFSNYLAKVFSIIKSNILLSIIAKASFTFIFSSSCLCKSLLLNIFKLLKFLFNASIILFDESVTFLPSKANSFETMKFELISKSFKIVTNSIQALELDPPRPSTTKISLPGSVTNSVSAPKFS